MGFLRPDIAYVVGRLSRYPQCSNQEHWDALARLTRYLRGSMDYAIEYSGFPAVLEGYSDANWITNSNETKSTSGYVFTLGVVQLHGDQLGKQLLQDQQWNLSLLFSKWLVVRLSG